MEVPNASRKLFQSRLLNLFLAVFVAYVLVLVLVRTFEPRLIFFPNYPDRLDGDWHPRALPVQDVWLTASDGVKLHAWWIPHDSAKFTFLAFHGNASNMANRAPTSTNFSAAHPQTSLPWNTGVMAAAKENRAKPGSITMPKRPTNTS